MNSSLLVMEDWELPLPLRVRDCTSEVTESCMHTRHCVHGKGDGTKWIKSDTCTTMYMYMYSKLDITGLGKLDITG